MDAFRLDGRVAAITGGARGIGYATASLFTAAGAQVVLLDLDEAAARDAAARLGPAASALRLDVASEDEVTRAFDAVVASTAASTCS
jgi:NAD(P)-dependent dehydrogenase (short-subunit alcohol dehydrogenase family)